MAQVQQNQTVFDLCLQEYGTLENLIADVIVPNKIIIDEDIKPDRIINLDTLNKGNNTIKNLIKEQGLIFTNTEVKKPAIGIGEMIIEDTFIVS